MRYIHWRYLWREMSHGYHHGIIFILCVALSISTLTALDSFKAGVNSSLTQDARSLHGADIILHSHYPFAQPLVSQLQKIEEKGQVQRSRVYRFYSVVRSDADTATLFANIKVVDNNFPLYGEVGLQSGKKLSESLVSGTVVVAPDVLKRLGLQTGQWILVGKARLQIVDVVTRESDSPINLLNFGPRVFVSSADVAKLDLIGKGSRIRYEQLLKVRDEQNIESLARTLKETVDPAMVRINTYEDAESRVKRFFDNLLFFLSLISIFTLLLAGLGMQSCLTALFRQKEKTIAIVKTLGVDSGFLHRHYLFMVLILGMAGTLLGLGGGAAIGLVLPGLFAGLIPVNGSLSLSLFNMGEGVIMGFAVVLLFTMLPLARLKKIKPAVIFRKESVAVSIGPLLSLAIAAGLLLVALLIVRQLEDVAIGLYFLVGVIILIGVIALCAQAILWFIRRSPASSLSLRQALRSMVRQGNGSRAIIVTLASALSLLFAIYLVQRNLHTTYIESYPPGAPNLFALDIQPDQRHGFLSFFADEPALYPVIRARLTAINGEAIKRSEEIKKKRDNFAREFNLTYRGWLLEDEEIIEGASLFTKDSKGNVPLQVSVLDDVVDMGDLKIGDILSFNIQGVEMEVPITSIRTRTKSRLYPFFYFVFPEQYLKPAPQTFFAAMYVDEKDIAALESDILKRYPNISFVNVSQAAKDIGVLMNKLSGIITFFSSFSILAGVLILISSILATRLTRVREAVYYKILGARSGFVSLVYLYENAILGLASGVIALLLAQAVSWSVCRFLFEIPYRPNVAASLLLLLGTTFVVVMVGYTSSSGIIRQKPATFLQQQNNG